MKKIMLFFYLSLGIFQMTLMAQQGRPNFVFILTDDQPYGYMACTGNKIVETPNLDQLSSEGILFTNAHVTSSICTPSRVSILLSQYERKHNVNFNSGTSVSDEAWAQSYPMVMRKSGYYTGWVGKNHAPVGEGGYASGVMEKSFDYWYAAHGHLGFYPKDRHTIFNDAIADTQVEIIQEGVNDFLDPNERKLKGAIRFLENRPKGKPFMLSINFNLPHNASTRTMEQRPSDDDIYKSLYRDIDLPLPDHYVAKADIKIPKLPADLLRASDRQTSYDYGDAPNTWQERYIRQLQSMTGIDRLVGRLREKLEKLNLDKNTIIIFTSDHGLFMGQYGLGGKALCYEITTHVPIIVYDPRAPKKLRGMQSDALVQSIDMAPTMLSMAGIVAPKTFQGKDISGLLKGDKKEVRDIVYTENLWSTQFGNPRCEAVQDKEWKYIRYYRNNTFSAAKKIKTAKEFGINVNNFLYQVHDQGLAIYRDYIESPLVGEQPVYEELYHLKTDPEEANNLIDDNQYAQEVNRLRKIWDKEIHMARGEGNPKVYRYTLESETEAGRVYKAE